MWDIQVVKDTSSCIDRVPQFTHSQITGDAVDDAGGNKDDDDSDDEYDEKHMSWVLQAKRHKPSLLFTSLTILTSLTFILR